MTDEGLSCPRCKQKVVAMNRAVLGSTIVFAPYSIDQALEGLAEAGYRACEIGAVKGWFEHIDPDTPLTPSCRISGKLTDLGLSPVSMSGHAQLQTQEGAARFARAIDIAAALGMEVVNTDTGDATTEAEREAYFANVAEFAITPPGTASGSAWRPTVTCSPPPRPGWPFSIASTGRRSSASITIPATSSTTRAATR